MKQTNLFYHERIWKYHNRKIEIQLSNFKLEKGVLLDNLLFKRKSTGTDYAWINFTNWNKYQLAFLNGQIDIMESLKKPLDIRKIKAVRFSV